MLGGDQTITISARTRVRAAAADVFAFLSTPCNHRRLQVAGIRLLSLDDGPDGALRGGSIALDGPVGLRRTARTSVTLCHAPHRLAGSAQLDSGTDAHVSWTLRPTVAGAVEVELTVVLGPIAGVDRVALALGGRRWVRGRFERTLRRLAAELERAPVAARGPGRALASRAPLEHAPVAARVPGRTPASRAPASGRTPARQGVTQPA